MNTKSIFVPKQNSTNDPLLNRWCLEVFKSTQNNTNYLLKKHFTIKNVSHH